MGTVTFQRFYFKSKLCTENLVLSITTRVSCISLRSLTSDTHKWYTIF
jgi:hypothetical protein